MSDPERRTTIINASTLVAEVWSMSLCSRFRRMYADRKSGRNHAVIWRVVDASTPFTVSIWWTKARHVVAHVD